MAHVAVIGAGPAGMAAAYELTQHGIAVDVYEASDAVGGMARSLNLWGQSVDLGPHHFLSDFKRINDLWALTLGEEYRVIDRLTRIYYQHQFFDYPLKIGNVLQRLHWGEALYASLSYANQSFNPVILDGSFEQYMIRQFGRSLYQTFFQPYTEKLWGLPCRELDAEFAQQRISRLDFKQAVLQACRPTPSTDLRTLSQRFIYPLNGAGQLYTQLQAQIEDQGGQFFFNTPVEAVITEGKQIRGIRCTHDNNERRYRHVVSTMPLSHLATHLSEAPAIIRQLAKQLRFRHTLLVYLQIHATDLFPDHWLYIHSPELQLGRITNFANWSPHTEQSILALEYWCYDDTPLWTASQADIIETAKRELTSTGLVQPNAIQDGFVYRIPRCYPVYTKGYRPYLIPIQTYLSTIQGLWPVGRYGAFKYNNQDHSMLMGLMAADNIRNGTHHSLWDFHHNSETTLSNAALAIECQPAYLHPLYQGVSTERSYAAI